MVREPQRGYGRACAAGVAALDPRSEIVCFLDGDGSDVPAFLPRSSAPLAADRADFVMGSRLRGRREPGSMTPQQLVAGRLAGLLLRMTYGVRFTDMSPFRAMRLERLRALGMREQTYGWNLEMQMRVAAARLRILEVPVDHRCRRGGVSKVSGNLDRRGARPPGRSRRLSCGWRSCCAASRRGRCSACGAKAPDVRVLLTGGAGFIGRHVLRELIARGHAVRVLDSLRPDVHGEGAAKSIEGAELMVADVRDAAAIDAALRGVDAVVHLAAKVGLGVDVGDMPDYASSNDAGTAELLAGMARADVGRLTLASSMVVYGEGLGRCPEHGEVRPAPRSRSAARGRPIRAAVPGLRPAACRARWSTRARRSIRATPMPPAKSRRNSTPPTGRA